jgi:hypothetical protein
VRSRFHLLGVFALFVATRALNRLRQRMDGPLRCTRAARFVLGVGAAGYSIGGITFVSHIVPAAVTLLAFGAAAVAGMSVRARCRHRRALLSGFHGARVARLLLNSRERMKRFLAASPDVDSSSAAGFSRCRSRSRTRSWSARLSTTRSDIRKVLRLRLSSAVRILGQRTGARGG